MQAQSDTRVLKQLFVTAGGMAVLVVDSLDNPTQIYTGRLSDGTLRQQTVGSQIDAKVQRLTAAHFGVIDIPADEHVDDVNTGWWFPDADNTVRLIRMDLDWFDIDIVGDEQEKALVSYR